MLVIELVLLLLQYALGMLVNLYVQIPSGSSGGFGMGWMRVWMGASGGGLLVWHMMNGWLVFLFALLVAMGFLLAGQVKLALASWVGFGAIAVAGVSGMLFLMSGGAPGYSLLMAAGFLVAVVIAVWELALSW
ncbi:MAG: hypothetical protein ACYCPN_07090 [Thermoplasmata archaeon]